MPAYTLVVHMYAKKDSVDKLKAKLQEASQVYSKDKECLSWLAMLSFQEISDQAN
jgi:predicted house-cleaning noncanonical NTP pyrophosphatase (MazG superfamily)